MPTRIFGIGLHKTGTTSLHHALKLLGFDSVHWPSAHWARRVYEEVKAGRSPTLDQHYAAVDLPIAILYKELDAMYPGAKFILTMRETESWLDSVEGHWNPETNPWRSQWDTDPFTHRLHTLIYGRRKFDRAVFRDRYLRHNLEVLMHFQDRPNQLMLTLLDAGWDQLCEFLNVPVPRVPYPKENVSVLSGTTDPT